MYENERLSVLRCGRCNKPFDQQASLKRHGYYCRSRTNELIPRSRSCTSCAKGKARCDHKRPICSRCSSRSLKCSYPTAKPAVRALSTLTDNSQPSPVTEAETHFGTAVAEAAYLDTVLAGELDPFDATFTAVETSEFDWSTSMIDFSTFLDPSANKDLLGQLVPIPSDQGYGSPVALDQREQFPYSPYMSTPFTKMHSPRSLVRRHKPNDVLLRTANLILNTLKSYPLGMLEYGELPPYIHPQSIALRPQNGEMESIDNCLSLMHMISKGGNGSRKLFWRNVQRECEHYCAQVTNFNKWQLLAVMQALSIYIIVRIDEGETDHNNLDQLLLTSVIIMSKHFNDMIKASKSEVERDNLEPTWMDWVFEESKRRLCVVYQILNLLVYFDPASVCSMGPGLFLAPLPARKLLWEAQDSPSWEAAARGGSRDAREYGMTTKGELVRFSEHTKIPHCRPHEDRNESPQMTTDCREIVDWKEWCCGMDSLGSLVMLSALLVV